ncbi:MAG: GGDEF domain-containing protein [Thermomicrobiales bacterium]|nr:GGDEF domain-containing protein [Thermomicrobiales bacterium]
MTVGILGVAIAMSRLVEGRRELYLIAFSMALWCAVSAWRRAAHREGRHRQGWYAASAGASIAALGQAWWCVDPPGTELSIGSAPGHVAMTASLVVFLIAVAYLRPPRRELADTRLVVLDLVIVTATLVTALWSLLIEPSSDGRVGLTATETFAAMHALAGGGLLLALFVIGLRLPSMGGQRSVVLLASGLTVVALGDVSWLAVWLHDGGSSHQLGASLVAASYTLLAIAMGRERRRHRVEFRFDEGEIATDASWRLWLLYPPVLLLSLIVGEAAIGGARRSTDPAVALGGLIVIALVLIRQGIAIQETRRLAMALRRQADRDPLTNLLNHRKLHERLDGELAATRRSGSPVAVALIDVDRFKQINDTLGHVVGDHVLRAIAGTLTRACRETDVAARYAGDEFALILPGLDGVSAAVVGDRLLDEVAALAYWPGPDAEYPVSISIGFAISRTGRLSARQMIAAADGALYSAKREGRNQFAVLNADLAEVEEEPAVDLRRLIVVHPAG